MPQPRASIDHDVLLTQLREHIDDSRLLDLLEQYIRRTVIDDGVYEDVTKGISLGCALSPVIGALYLDRLDKRMEATGLVYARFMDDWVILAPTRWKLRAAIRCVNQTLNELNLAQHPDKTFIGRVSRGFDFLGYRISSTGLAVAQNTAKRFTKRVTRLYEQGADAFRIGEYVRRWCVWVRSGLGPFCELIACDSIPLAAFPTPVRLSTFPMNLCTQGRMWKAQGRHWR